MAPTVDEKPNGTVIGGTLPAPTVTLPLIEATPNLVDVKCSFTLAVPQMQQKRSFLVL
jgi:hypothetical protein